MGSKPKHFTLRLQGGILGIDLILQQLKYKGVKRLIFEDNICE